jgi:hypothetical protein
MTDKVDALLAELDAEFGKKAKPKKGDSVRELNKTFNQRNSTGGFNDVAQAANAMSRSWSQIPGYRAVRRITWIINEHCDNCINCVSYVGNTFVEFHNRRLKATVQSAEAVTHDEHGQELPVAVEESHHSVALCAACLRLSRRVEDHLMAALINGVPKQTDLSFQIVKEAS